MSREWKLSPVELYFCGRLMNAKYCDYAYIAAMQDVQREFDLMEQEALEQLEEKEMIETDFDGHVLFDGAVKDLLTPVFFGKTESRLDREGYPACRFHIFGEQITRSVFEGGEIRLSRVTEQEIRTLLGTEKTQVHCADVRRGSRKLAFKRGELKQEKKKEQAVALLKGEM